MVTVPFGGIPYNITGAAVCSVTVSPLGFGLYTGTPVSIEVKQGTQIEPQSTTLDPLMDGGLPIALATVLTHANFTLGMAGYDYNAMQIAGGYQVGVSSASQYEIYPEAGGGGLPYFSMIMTGATADGNDVMLGLPLAKLDTLPNVSINMNEWTISEISGKAIANRKSVKYARAPYIKRPNTNRQTITLTAAFFNTFFDVAT